MNETTTPGEAKRKPTHIFLTLPEAQAEVALIKADTEAAGKPYKVRTIYKATGLPDNVERFVIGQSKGRAGGHVTALAGINLLAVDPPRAARAPRAVTVEAIAARLEMVPDDIAKVEEIIARMKAAKAAGGSPAAPVAAKPAEALPKTTEPAKSQNGGGKAHAKQPAHAGGKR